MRDEQLEGHLVVGHPHRDGAPGVAEVPLQRRLLAADQGQRAGPELARSGPGRRTGRRPRARRGWSPRRPAPAAACPGRGPWRRAAGGPPRGRTRRRRCRRRCRWAARPAGRAARRARRWRCRPRARSRRRSGTAGRSRGRLVGSVTSGTPVIVPAGRSRSGTDLPGRGGRVRRTSGPPPTKTRRRGLALHVGVLGADHARRDAAAGPRPARRRASRPARRRRRTARASGSWSRASGATDS